jgi:hypothetical protein
MAANWGLPLNTTPYADVLAILKARDDDLAKMMDPALSATPSEPAIGWTRWNGTNRNWERYGGSSWAALATSYGISITGTAANVTGTVAVGNGGTGSSTAAGARSSLGLGSLATANNVNNTNWSGTALAVGNGGTGATSVAGARANLNVPARDGTDASGTWPISITGTAGATSSAVKLTTARQINGTNFDGTGNITTASWGASRSITLNGSAKSVDGSASVAWTLQEILPIDTLLRVAALGVGAAAGGAGTLTVASHITCGGNFTSTGSITSNSDERLKSDWIEMPEGFVDALSTLKAGSYFRNDLRVRQVGVGAQSLRRLCEDAVISENGRLSVAYGQMAMVGVVELAKEIVKLKRELKGNK